MNTLSKATLNTLHTVTQADTVRVSDHGPIFYNRPDIGGVELDY